MTSMGMFQEYVSACLCSCEIEWKEYSDNTVVGYTDWNQQGVGLWIGCISPPPPPIAI